MFRRDFESSTRNPPSPSTSLPVRWIHPGALDFPMHASPMLSREQERDLHRRLVEDDPTASVDLAETYYVWLIACLKNKNPDIHEEACVSAATDAWKSLVKNPRSYDPDKLPLSSFLRMSAQGDLRNLLKKEVSHRHESLDSVEDSLLGGNDEKEPAILPFQRDSASAILKLVREGLSAGELRALDLWLQGERTTKAFADALDLKHLSSKEQKDAVKRSKDKIKKRVERARREHDEST